MKSILSKEFSNFETKLRDINIQTEKIEIMKLILETDNPNILESVKDLSKKGTITDFGKTLS